MNEMDKNRKGPNDMKNKNIFTTPDGYFDKLPDRIQARIDEQEGKSKTIKVSWHIRYAAAAAAVILIVWFGVFQSKFQGEEGPVDYNMILAEVSTDELVAYMETYSESTYLEEVQLDNLIEEGSLDQEKFNEVFEEEQDILNGYFEEEELLLEIDELI